MTVTLDTCAPWRAIGVTASSCGAFSAVTRNGSVTVGVTVGVLGGVTGTVTGDVTRRVTVPLRFFRRKRLARSAAVRSFVDPTGRKGVMLSPSAIGFALLLGAARTRRSHPLNRVWATRLTAPRHVSHSVRGARRQPLWR